MKTQACEQRTRHTRHTWSPGPGHVMAICPGYTNGKCPECQGRPGAHRIWCGRPDDTPTFDARELFPCPNPVITDGSYQDGDLILIPARVTRKTAAGILTVQYNGVEGERTLSETVVAELVRRERKSPGQRAYEAAPYRLGSQPWGELGNDDQAEWETIAAAARED